MKKKQPKTVAQPTEPMKLRDFEPAGPIKLNSEQEAMVRAAEKNVVDMKCRLANLTIQQMNAASDAVRAEQLLIDKISELARLNGINPENAGLWGFDTKQMIFTKQAQPQ